MSKQNQKFTHQEQMKIIENIVPINGEACPFLNCLASLIFSVKKEEYEPKSNSKTAIKAASEKRGSFSACVTTASGLAFSYIFNTNYDDRFDKTQYYKAFGNDDYIKYALNFARCNYRIISDDDEMLAEIKKSIDKNIPVLAERLSDSSWCLIAGYDDNKLYGYTAGCPYCQNCVNCVGRKVDGHIDNGMFNISGRMPERIIIIDDFNAEPYDDKTFLNYLISVMEHKPNNGFVFGNDAYDAVIKLLENDDSFFVMDNNKLYNLYRQIYINSFLPEYRFCSRWLEYTIQLPEYINKNEYPGLYNSYKKHGAGYKFWAALSEKGEWKTDIQKYAVMLQERSNRKNAVKELKQLKKMDELTLQELKKIT